MPARSVRVPSRSGGNFDCYVVVPEGEGPTSAIVLASAVHGVDADIRALADEFGRQGFIAAAPDLFWRSIPGPLPHGDDRTSQRALPRLERIRTGESDMADTLMYVRTIDSFNGGAAAMGFCYGGP
jgi:carboxymethylenebutenolidase